VAEDRLDRARKFLSGELEAPPPVTVAPGVTIEGGRIKAAREFLGLDPETPLGPGMGTAISLQELQEQGVDIESGAGTAGARAMISLVSPERRNTVLEQAFPDGFRETAAGTVVTVRQNGALREVLLDETGLSLNDFADLAGTSVEAGSAIAGVGAALAAAPGLAVGGLSLALLAVIAGVSGQVGGGAAEVIADMKAGGIDLDNSDDRAMLENMVKRRGINAAVDSVLDFTSGGLLAGGGKVSQFAVGPLARRMAESPQKEIREAASELGIDLSTGQKTGVPTLLKAEELQSKVPGSAGLIREKRRTAERQLSEARERLTGDVETAAEVGKAATREVRGQQAALEADVETIGGVAERTIQREFAGLAKTASRRSLSFSEAGKLSRRGLQRQRLLFRKKQTELEDQAQELIDALPAEQQSFASTDIVRSISQKLRDEFPKTKVINKETQEVTAETIGELFPPTARRILNGLDKLPEKTTVDELRKSRQVISALIDDADALPGISTGLLKKIESSLTAQIRKATDEAPTDEIKESLTRAIAHYRKENTKFRTKIVSRAMRDETQPGFVEDADLLPGLLLKGNVEDAKRIINVLGENHPAVKTARRAVIDDMFAGSRNSFQSGGFAVDPKELRRRFDGLSTEARRLVFGADENKAQALIQSLAARHGLIDVSAVRRTPGDESLFSLLEQVQAASEIAKSRFDREVFRPLLAGRGGRMTEDQFVRHVMKTASPADIRQLFSVLPPDVAQSFRKRTVLELLSSAQKRATGAEQQLEMLTRDIIPAGDNLGRTLAQDFGPTPEESFARIRQILGDNGFEAVRQLAVVEAARLRSDQAGRAVGGLVGGSILSNLLRLQVGAAVDIGLFRFMAFMLNNRATSAWLASPIKFPTRSKTTRAFEIVLPKILEGASQELGEESEGFQRVKDFFEKDVPRAIGVE